MEEKHLESAVQILKKIQYITIATVCKDGSPWNTPVAPSLNNELVFRWGSNEESVHSQNIRNEERVFIVIYDSTVPEGEGEGVYMKGVAKELDEHEGVLRIYTFTPEKVWINDEIQDENGNFKMDIRVELDIEKLKQRLGTG